MIKKIILSLFAIAMLNSAYADITVNPNNATKLTVNSNTITINNNTSFDIAYEVQREGWSSVYGISKNGADTYTYNSAGHGDDVLFLVSKCHHLEPAYYGATCSQYDTLKSCVKSHYNVLKIKSIQIKSLTSCIVTCVDGGTTSCKR